MFLVAFLMVGVASGVIVTALASAVNAPTPRSFFVNLFLGGVGVTAGLFLGLTRAKSLEILRITHG